MTEVILTFLFANIAGIIWWKLSSRKEGKESKKPDWERKRFGKSRIPAACLNGDHNFPGPSLLSPKSKCVDCDSEIYWKWL